MKGKLKLLVFIFIYCCFYNQVLEGNNKCLILQEAWLYTAPAVPDFLTRWNKTQCQVHNNGGGLLRCGQTEMFIKRECVCTYHNVIEATRYHQYSSCPPGDGSDNVTQLKCGDCKRYSLNNAGPCINGGKLNCKGDEVAHEIKCECPSNARGAFCEEKIQQVARICDEIPKLSIKGLKDCNLTWDDCVTYSRNRRYSYKCNTTMLFKDKLGLPLCNDTENTTVNPKTDRNAAHVSRSDFAHNSAIGKHVSINMLEFTVSVFFLACTIFGG